jgi:5-(carboxyamino)imidazole ribonucleotide synthase
VKQSGGHELGPTVGMIGAGQLAQMSVAPATALGVRFRVLANNSEEPAALVAADTIIGSKDDPRTVLAFAQSCDVVTFDHELLTPDVMEVLKNCGKPVYPSPEAVIYAQDKIFMRRALTDLGIPCPRWSQVDSKADAKTFAREVGFPFILKTSRGGYDGKGVWFVNDESEINAIFENELPAGSHWLAEEKVNFVRELAVQVARSPSDQCVAYPVVQTTQRNGICAEVIAPAPDLDPKIAVMAAEIALRIARELDVVGMLAVELFDTGDGVLVNELAMRAHNSGHWSIEGAATSQFENHLRAVLDLPLGSPRAIATWSVMGNILGGNVPNLYSAYRHVFARDQDLHTHLYGKVVKPGRKVGHVTASGSDLTELRNRVEHAVSYFTGEINE